MWYHISFLFQAFKSSQRCGWDIRSCGMWHRVTSHTNGYVFFKLCIALVTQRYFFALQLFSAWNTRQQHFEISFLYYRKHTLPPLPISSVQSNRNKSLLILSIIVHITTLLEQVAVCGNVRIDGKFIKVIVTYLEYHCTHNDTLGAGSSVW